MDGFGVLKIDVIVSATIRISIIPQSIIRYVSVRAGERRSSDQYGTRVGVWTELTESKK